MGVSVEHASPNSPQLVDGAGEDDVGDPVGCPPVGDAGEVTVEHSRPNSPQVVDADGGDDVGDPVGCSPVDDAGGVGELVVGGVVDGWVGSVALSVGDVLEP